MDKIRITNSVSLDWVDYPYDPTGTTPRGFMTDKDFTEFLKTIGCIMEKEKGFEFHFNEIKGLICDYSVSDTKLKKGYIMSLIESSLYSIFQCGAIDGIDMAEKRVNKSPAK